LSLPLTPCLHGPKLRVKLRDLFAQRSTLLDHLTLAAAADGTLATTATLTHDLSFLAHEAKHEAPLIIPAPHQLL
jgi:hypothetical protein